MKLFGDPFELESPGHYEAGINDVFKASVVWRDHSYYCSSVLYESGRIKIKTTTHWILKWPSSEDSSVSRQNVCQVSMEVLYRVACCVRAGSSPYFPKGMWRLPMPIINLVSFADSHLIYLTPCLVLRPQNFFFWEWFTENTILMIIIIVWYC